MANLKTNYKDRLLDTSVNTERKFNLVDQDGNVIVSGVSLRDITQYSQAGDTFGAADVNKITAKINGIKNNLTRLGVTTLLYSTTTSADAENITLSDNLNNYRYIFIYNEQGMNMMCPVEIFKILPELTNITHGISNVNDYSYMMVIYVDEYTINLTNKANGWTVKPLYIYGVK